jgi:uncharacterized Zn finger protein (UPF0148 family)
MEKHLILDFKELHLIGIECAKCKTTTLFEIDNPRIPVSCPSCEKFFYDGVSDRENPIHKFVAALNSLKASTHRFTAHIAGAPIEL